MNVLANLLAPYQRAVQGLEPDYESDPLYMLLGQPGTPPPPPAGSAVYGSQNPGQVPGDLSGIQALAAKLAAKRYGWSGPQWQALQELVSRESGWNPTAQNPNSTAFGLMQFLDSTWAGTGFQKTSDPRLQLLAGLKYIANRYGSPSAALAFHDQNNWY